MIDQTARLTVLLNGRKFDFQPSSLGNWRLVIRHEILDLTVDLSLSDQDLVKSDEDLYTWKLMPAINMLDHMAYPERMNRFLSEARKYAKQLAAQNMEEMGLEMQS